MDLINFLSRVIAPGNFLCVSFSSGTDSKPNNSRFFPRDELSHAANFIEYLARQNTDVYHAQSSFVDAHAQGVNKIGKSKLYGGRKAVNAQALKTFWIDLDIKRDGDKKTAANSYPDRLSALQWADDFCTAIKIPKWSLAVSSGFGIHLYWVLEDPMPVADWLPYGQAWTRAMVSHKFKGDSGISGNPVCLLRPPNTFNLKTGSAVPTFVYANSVRGDVPNQMMLDALQPYLPTHLTPTAPGQTPSSIAAALAGPGSNVVSLYKNAPNMNAAAQAAMPAPYRQKRSFATLASPHGCAQVIHSLQDHGATDTRQLWYLGFISMAVFCDDGEDFIHIIGDAHPTYNKTQTDAEFQRAKTEQAAKGTGWPLCNHFNTHRPSVCAGCPHFDPAKITPPGTQSPLHFAEPKDDLPEGYRRHNNKIQKFVKGDKNGFWETILEGDIFDPELDEIPFGGFNLQFKHRLVNKTYTIKVSLHDIFGDASTIARVFNNQHLIVLTGREQEWRTFLLAFTQMLRAQQRERVSPLEPFGWLIENEKHAGFALAGQAYMADGTVEDAPGGDPLIVTAYTPKGELGPWQDAARFTLNGRPDLQVIVAASFAAPLVSLTGHKGIILSAWSRESGVGKTSALIVAQGVWGAPSATMSLNDTHNAVNHRLGQTKVLPAFWDEMQIGNDKAGEFVQFLFRMSQGKEKARMGSNMQTREAGEWATLMVSCSNFGIMDHVAKITAGTEAGALRLFEYKITHPSMPQDPTATRIIAQASTNFGHAGVIYAKYLAANKDRLTQALDVQLTKIIYDTNASQSERMYSAFIACTMIGARVAKKLGLVDFNLPQIENFLYNVYYTSRKGRKKSLLVSHTGYQTEDILSGFMSEFMSRKIITKRYTSGNTRADVKWWPQDRHRVDIHISQDDALLRFDRELFVAYCDSKNLVGTDVVEHMCRTYNGQELKATLAAGTGFASGRRRVVEIPLVLPELESYKNTPEDFDNHPSGKTISERMKETKDGT